MGGWGDRRWGQTQPHQHPSWCSHLAAQLGQGEGDCVCQKAKGPGRKTGLSCGQAGRAAQSAGLAKILSGLSASLLPAHPTWGLKANPLLTLWVEAPPKEIPKTHTI